MWCRRWRLAGKLICLRLSANGCKRGTCNARRDIEEQCQEIEKEVWYEGERRRRPVSPAGREEIARSWARHHASNWREWRLFQLLYVWNKNAEQYLPLLAEA